MLAVSQFFGSVFHLKWKSGRKQIRMKPKYDWINILEQKVSKDKYGYVGEVAWNTDRNENIQRISSIHLNEHYGFNKLFLIEKPNT